jgi:hypothetical protein
MTLTPSEGLSSSHAVFSGEVIDIERNETTRFGGLEVTLQVKRVWKGEPKEEIKVRTAGSSAACGYTFVKGKTYLVYAVSDDADPMRVSLCSRTAPIEDAKEDLDFLGKPSHRYDDGNGRCTASLGTTESTRLGWMVLLLAGATLMMRRLI